MKRTIAFVAVASVVALAAPSQAATQAQFEEVRIGWSAWHVKNELGTPGAMVVAWVDGHGRRHVIKKYSFTDSEIVRGRIEFKRGIDGRYRVLHKREVSRAGRS